MPADVRLDFDHAPPNVRAAYTTWWAERPNKAAAHRDTWPAYKAAWTTLSSQITRILTGR